ncbi:MAG: glycosyltransferase family 39 protein [Candidatus Gottesmanbacteria bacterium]
MAFFIIIALYFITRLIFLTSLPIFNDESIYLHWALIMRDTGEKFYSVAFDGKQPMIMWLYGVALWLVDNPLVVGRLVSVIFGFFTLLGIYFLAKSIGNRNLALISSSFYIFCPICVFFDRMALMDGPITSINIWTLFLTEKIINTKNKYIFSLLLGLIFGLGFWIKSSILITILIILLWLIKAYLNKKNIYIINSIILIIITALLALIPLIVQPSFNLIFQKNQEFILSVNQILKFPWQIWLNNLMNLGLILTGYVSPLILIFLFIFLLKKSELKNWRFLFVYLVSSMFLLIISSKDINSRYSLFIIPELLILISILMAKYKWIRPFIFIPSIILSIILIITPIRFFSLFPSFGSFASDKYQYINGWPSGYGINEAINLLNNTSRKRQIIIGVRPDSGNPEDAIWTYYWQDKQAMVTYFRSDTEYWQNLKEYSQLFDIYFISRDDQLLGQERVLSEIIRFPKPNSKSYIGVYKINLSKL